MIRLFKPLLPVVCIVLLSTCGKKQEQQDSSSQGLSHEEVLFQKIEKLKSIMKDKTVDASTQAKNQKEFEQVLDREYQSSLPISPDSAAKVLISPFPMWLDKYAYRSKEMLWLANRYPDMPMRPLYQGKKYFFLGVSYAPPVRKRGVGCSIIIVDEGAMPEWRRTYLADRIYRCLSGGPFEKMLGGVEYDETIDFGYHKWAVWNPSPSAEMPERAFITFWNNRFTVLAASSDMTKEVPDYLAKVINVQWMNKLK